MKFTSISFLSIMVTLLMMGFVSQASAVQMTVFLAPESDKADAIFTSVRFIEFKYDKDSALAKQFAGKTERLTFSLNGTEGGMPQLIAAINKDILEQKKSPTHIEKANIVYTATARGEPDRVTIAYKVELKSTLSRFVLERNSDKGAVLDLDWRGVSVKEPLVVDTQKYGKFNVNYPISAIQALYPELAQKLINSNAKTLMTDPLFDFEEIGTPMERWHFLFDPTGSQAGAAALNLTGSDEGARVVSVYSLGESSFREGTHTAKEKDATATVDGTAVAIHTSTPPPSGQIQIAGFSNIQKVKDGELAFVTSQAPAGTYTATGGFPIQVLLILGGMMGAVAVFVLIKARK